MSEQLLGCRSSGGASCQDGSHKTPAAKSFKEEQGAGVIVISPLVYFFVPLFHVSLFSSSSWSSFLLPHGLRRSEAQPG